jgi:hypothetical protein
MSAEPARRYQLADLVNTHLGAVETLERAPRNEPTVVYCKRNRFEQCLVLAIERAIDKYSRRVRARRR